MTLEDGKKEKQTGKVPLECLPKLVREAVSEGLHLFWSWFEPDWQCRTLVSGYALYAQTRQIRNMGLAERRLYLTSDEKRSRYLTSRLEGWLAESDYKRLTKEIEDLIGRHRIK